MPKDYSTGRPRGYAFINFFTNEEAKRGLEDPDLKQAFGPYMKISYAHNPPNKSSKNRSSSKRCSRSRSSSPIKERTVDELELKIEVISKENKAFRAKISTLQDEINGCKAVLANCVSDYTQFKLNLDIQEATSQIFLPCGHLKLLNLKDIEFIDGLYEAAVMRLSEAERRNERFLMKLRSKIYYRVEQKRPEVYRCWHKENWTIRTCRHTIQAECSDIRLHEKGVKYLDCSICLDSR